MSYNAEHIIGNGSFGVVFQAVVVETGEVGQEDVRGTVVEMKGDGRSVDGVHALRGDLAHKLNLKRK